MKNFSYEDLAGFLGCECVQSEYSSPIHPRSTTYSFRAVSPHGTLSLTVNPAQGLCLIFQMDAMQRELASATVHVSELKVAEERNDETGEFEKFIAGVGPGGHICISRTDEWFTVFYSMYGDRSRHRSGPSERPANGLVPTGEVAIRIAEAVLVPLYGAERIRAQMPFKVELSAGVWTVEGVYPVADQPTGIALVQLRQEDGQLLRVTHGQWP